MNRLTAITLGLSLALSAPVLAAPAGGKGPGQPPAQGQQGQPPAQGEQGQGQPQPPRLPLEIYDLNGDGKVSAEEVETVRKSAFAAGDADHNGYLDLAELAALLKAERDAAAAARFAKLDTDGNGTLTQSEFAKLPLVAPEASSRLFVLADSDHSDGISAAELEALLAPGNAAVTFVRMDHDANGGLSEIEFLGPKPGQNDPQ